MEWSWTLDGTGVVDPLKAMDRAFAVIEKDLAAVDDALDRLDKKQKSKAALADMASALGRKGEPALQAPDIKAFGKQEDQIDILSGASPEQKAAYKATLRDFMAQQDKWDRERESKRKAELDRQAAADEKRQKDAESLAHRSAGIDDLQRITKGYASASEGSSKYAEGLKKLDKELEKLERHQKLEQALAIKDPTQRHIALLRYHRDEAVRNSSALEKNKASFLGWAAAGLMAWEAGKKVVDISREMVRLAIEEGGQRRAGIRTFGVMLGNKKAASEEWDLLEEMSDKTKYTTESMMADYKNLFSFTQAYGARATHDVMAAAADIGVILDESSKNTFIETIKHIQGMEKADSRSVMMLQRSGLLTRSEVENALAKQLGMDPAKTGTTEKIKKMLEQGKIRDDKAISAILEAVRKKYSGGGALGHTSVEASVGSVGTQIKNLERMWGNMFDSLDVKPFASAITKMAALLDPKTLSGQRIAEDIQKAFNIIVASIEFGIKHFEKLEKVVRGLLDTITFMAKVLPALTIQGAVSGELGDALKMLEVDKDKILAEEREKATKKQEEKYGTSLPPIAPVSDAEFDSKLKAMEEQLAVMAKNVETVGTQNGIRAIESYTDGMMSKRPDVVDVASTVAGATEEGFQTRLEMHSPSKVLDRLGQTAALSFSTGFEKVGPPDVMVPSPKFSTASELSASMAAASQASTPAVRSGSTTSQQTRDIKVEVDINVMGGSASAAQQWSEIQPQVRAEFIRLTESLAEED